MSLQVICLKYSGGISCFEMKSISDDTIKLINIPKSYKRTKGCGKLTCQHEYSLNEKIYALHAWNDGDAGEENKHELPPPLDKELYFGNAYIVAYKNDKQIDATIDDYKKLQEQYFEGFDDLSSTDSWSEEEELSDTDSLHDFIVEG
jgi:hypothetical protein